MQSGAASVTWWSQPSRTPRLTKSRYTLVGALGEFAGYSSSPTTSQEPHPYPADGESAAWRPQPLRAISRAPEQSPARSTTHWPQSPVHSPSHSSVHTPLQSPVQSPRAVPFTHDPHCPAHPSPTVSPRVPVETGANASEGAEGAATSDSAAPVAATASPPPTTRRGSAIANAIVKRFVLVILTSLISSQSKPSEQMHSNHRM